MNLIDRLDNLSNFVTVPIEEEQLRDLRSDRDFIPIHYYRHLNIVPLVPGELGCHLRARARYVLEEAS